MQSDPVQDGEADGEGNWKNESKDWPFRNGSGLGENSGWIPLSLVDLLTLVGGLKQAWGLGSN